MLKNRIIGRKIRNIVILFMAIVVMIGTYKYIDKSKAEKVIEIGAIVLDNYGYLENEEFILEAKKLEEETYEVELPESINGKKINRIVKIGLGELESTTAQATETILEDNLEMLENRIYLTKEQIDTQQINIEIAYDVALLEQKQEGEYNKIILSEKSEEERNQLQITEETEKLYSKILRYEDNENGKLVEVKGYLPIDAELQVEEVSQEQLTQIFGNKKIEVAYDIKILTKVVTTIPVDEANPNSELEEIVETIEISPEEFGEKCEVVITDVDIVENSQVYHVKEDNTYEEVNIKENTEGNISFEAETFSIYAVSSGEETNTSDATGTIGEIDSSDTTGTTGELDEFEDELIPDEGTEVGVSLGTQVITINDSSVTAQVLDITESGYSVLITGVPTDGSVKYVSFMTWSITNAQDDIVGYNGYVGTGGAVHAVINKSEHNNENGVYATHIYFRNSSDTGYTTSAPIVAVQQYVGPDSVKPTCDAVTVTNLTKDGFTVNAKASDDGVGVSFVNFCVWTEKNGQDDFNATQVSVPQNGVYSCNIKTSDHGNEEGTYFLHVYVYDAFGNKSAATGSNRLINHTNAGTEYAEATFKVYIDRTPPTLSATSLYAPSQEEMSSGGMLVKISDDYSGIASSAKYRYAWTSSSVTSSPASSAYTVVTPTYQNGDKIVYSSISRQGEKLWVKPYNSTIKDLYGNILVESAENVGSYSNGADGSTGLPKLGVEDVKIVNLSKDGYDIYVKPKSSYEGAASINHLTFPSWQANVGIQYLGDYTSSSSSWIGRLQTSGTYTGYWKYSVKVAKIYETERR